MNEVAQSDPLVSVVIPVYNRESCVNDSIGSVLSQTYSALECVVIDDGSTDSTRNVVEAAFGTDARVTVLVRSHAGVSAARNHGIAASRGSFLTFLDSDDVMTPDRIERQIACLSDGSFDAVMGCQQVMPGDGPLPDWVERDRDAWNRPYHMSILTAKERVLAIGGFDERLEVGEDIDFVVRLAAAGARIAYLEETIVIRRYFGDNLSNDIVDPDGRTLFAAVRRVLAERRAAHAE